MPMDELGVCERLPAKNSLTPGCLLEPFGWAAQSVAALLGSQPGLLDASITMDRSRLHLVAFAIAHLGAEGAMRLGTSLFLAPQRSTVHAVLGRCPHGLRRVFARLEPLALERENYHRLVDLLEDRACAKLLYHAQRVDDDTIKMLHGLPPAVRTPTFLALTSNHWSLKHLAQGLRMIASRGAAPSFEALIDDLARYRQPAQLLARLGQLVERIPLPPGSPPERVGSGRRLDDSATIRSLAKRWKNCLASYVDGVNSGHYAVYLWTDEPDAVCVASREGRLGWFLADALGERNAKPGEEQFHSIQSAFAEAGLPDRDTAWAITQLTIVPHG